MKFQEEAVLLKDDRQLGKRSTTCNVLAHWRRGPALGTEAHGRGRGEDAAQGAHRPGRGHVEGQRQGGERRLRRGVALERGERDAEGVEALEAAHTAAAQERLLRRTARAKLPRAADTTAARAVCAQAQAHG